MSDLRSTGDVRGWTLLCMGLVTASVFAQALPARTGPPAANGFSLPEIAGTLNYSLTASERVGTGGSGTEAVTSLTSVSADVALLTPGTAHPFSLLYSGGYLSATGGQVSGFFQNLALSQVIDTKNYNLVVADSLSYLPETPTSGLSGLAGLGDLGFPPVSITGDPAQEAIVQNAVRLSNQTSASVQRKLTGSTFLTGSARHSLIRFVRTRGIENDTSGLSGGLAHRIDDRTNLSAQYTFDRFSFVGVDGSFVTQGISLQYTRQLTRKVKLLLSGGPQRVDGSSLTGSPPSYSFTADVNASYTGARSTWAADYLRAITGGSGFTLGTRNDTIGFDGHRQLSKPTSVSYSLRYAQTRSISILVAEDLSTRTLVGNLQANRALTDKLSGYVSVSVQQQKVTGVSSGLPPLNGVTEYYAVGLTYTPQASHFGRH